MNSVEGCAPCVTFRGIFLRLMKLELRKITRRERMMESNGKDIHEEAGVGRCSGLAALVVHSN